MIKNKDVFIHESSYVDQGAEIGAGTSIWHFSHVESTAKIGENCNLGQNAYVGDNAKVGNGTRLANSVAVFSHIELEDFVFCGPFMVFTHVDYPRSAVSRRQLFSKTLVKRGATLGANSTILPDLIVGEGAFVAAGAVLTKSCPDWSLMVGVPAKQVGWVSALGERMDLENVEDSWTCDKTGDVYRLTQTGVVRTAGKLDILSYKDMKNRVRPVLTPEGLTV